MQRRTRRPASPAPPLSRRPAAWWAAAVTVTLLALIAVEGSSRARLDGLTRRADEAIARLHQVEAEIDRIGELNERVSSLDRSIESERLGLRRLQALQGVLEVEVPQRAALLPTVLAAVADVVNDHVAVNIIEMDPQQRLQVAGWSLTQSATEEFAQGLDQRLREHGLAVGHRAVERRKGRLGLEGYGFQVRLEPVDGARAQSPSSAGTGGERRPSGFGAV